MKRFRRATAALSATAGLLAAGLAMTAAPASAAHVVCGQLITASITLDSDVGPCPGDGLVVTASNVTVDLGGKRVFAANGAGDNAGIRLTGQTGVTVTGGTVEGFDAGVAIEGGSGNTVRGLTAQNNVNDFLGRPCLLGDGIGILDSSDNLVAGNQVLNNGPFGGVSVVGDSDRNVIRDNVASGNNIVGQSPGGCGNSRQDEGIRIEGPGADANRVENNRVEKSLLAGIGLHGFVCGAANPAGNTAPNQGTVVVGNVVSGTAGTGNASGINFLEQGPAGIVCASFGNTVEGNSSTGNEGDGIFVANSSHDNVISRNVVNGNGFSGLFLNDPAFNNTFTNVGPTLLDLVSPDRAPFVEGTDYRVMPGSGSGDVTGTLKAIDIAISGGGATNTNPVDTSTSGCEQADYDAAGFQAGDVALIQRGTCTFVAKVNLAIANGASAVVMFNEGQTNRTTFAFGSVSPVTIPVLSTTFAVGVDLFNLTQAGSVTINVVTNTTNVQVLAAPAPFNNTLFGNRGSGNGNVDGYDGNVDPPCDNNKWRASRFGTVNQPCVVGAGGSGEARGRTGSPGRSADAGQDIGRNAPTSSPSGVTSSS